MKRPVKNSIEQRKTAREYACSPILQRNLFLREGETTGEPCFPTATEDTFLLIEQSSDTTERHS